MKQNNHPSVSKITIQKLLYFTYLLAPIKKAIFKTIKFVIQKRGPYSKDIQNVIDHLLARGIIDIVKYHKLNGNNSIAYYKICEGGEYIVKSLEKYSKEEEKIWWINTIVKISILYSTEKELMEDDKFSGMDKIVRLVYQDPTFLDAKKSQHFKTLIELDNIEHPTAKMISFTKDFIEKNDTGIDNTNERRLFEIILIAFFELLYSNYLNSIIDE